MLEGRERYQQGRQRAVTPLAPQSILLRRETVRFLVFFISAGLFSAALIKPLLAAVTTDVVSRLLDELHLENEGDPLSN